MAAWVCKKPNLWYAADRSQSVCYRRPSWGTGVWPGWTGLTDQSLVENKIIPQILTILQTFTQKNWNYIHLSQSYDKILYQWWEASWPDSDAWVLWRLVTDEGAHWWSTGSSLGQTSAMGSQRRAPGCVDVGASRGTCGWAEALLAPVSSKPDCCCTACWELRDTWHRTNITSKESMDAYFLIIVHYTWVFHTVSHQSWGGQWRGWPRHIGTARWVLWRVF